MVISPAFVDDAARAAALFDASYDDRLNTVAGIRYRIATAQPEDRIRYWRAEVGDDLVGYASAGIDGFAAARTAGFAGIVVHPRHRRMGVGSALWNVIEGHLAEIGVRRVLGHSCADDDSVAFLRRRGFNLEATETSSALDPRSIGAPPEPPEAVEIVPLGAFAADPEPVYLADREGAIDEPGPSDFSGATYESWLRVVWGHPDCDHELSAAAVVADSIVGATFLYSDRAKGQASNGGTGVMRAFRGRGLALLMKQHSLAWAAAAGITRVITQNDETNAPMLAINRRLGYEPFAVGHAWVREN